MTDTTLNMDSVNANQEGKVGAEDQIRRPTLGWTLLHLRRSAHRLSRGLRKRLYVLGDEWVAAPLEEASWKLAEKVENLGQSLFHKIDCKIDQLTSKKKKTIEDEVEIGRFDDEGGAMMATCIPKRKTSKAAKPSSQSSRTPYEEKPQSTGGIHH